MSVGRPHRIMWLLNHTAARKFELPMLKSIGFNEIFTPKKFPQEHNFRSASVDFSEDDHLTIPAEDLKVLNDTDWYKPVARDIWQIANRHFDILFFIAHDMNAVANVARNFKGALVWRAYGLDRSLTYSALLLDANVALTALGAASRRFWFGAAYDALPKVEAPLLSSREAVLPLGMPETSSNDGWDGQDARILFVCPEIAFNPYYSEVYKTFISQHGTLPHAIGGAQPVSVDKPNVLGFVSREQHERNMKQFRVMFYHSTEPRHLHYHPLEAVRQGMPLVFMGGGLLDDLGGKNLPGRAASPREAHSKLSRVLKGDKALIAEIRSSQTVLVDGMHPDAFRQRWREGMAKIVQSLPVASDATPSDAGHSKPRVAIIVPVGYSGGSLRGAKLLAHAMLEGSRQFGEDAEVVLGHLDQPDVYSEADWLDLHPDITRRTYQWSYLNATEAKDAMELAGFAGWQANGGHFMVPNDGMKQFGDCDVWLLISDRLSYPVLPMRPRIHMIYDYIQRYLPIQGLGHGGDGPFLDAAHRASKVLVTTEFTRADAIQYGGVPSEKVAKLPMLAPLFAGGGSAGLPHQERDYFIWTTNASPHKNHKRALEALAIYYNELDGGLQCHITGVNTHQLLDGAQPALEEARTIFKKHKIFRRQIRQLGQLSDTEYKRTLARSRFIWHPALIDNGTFSVVEAASLGVPALSSDYPPMREIDAQFSLNLSYFDPRDPSAMARALKSMEEDADERRARLPTADVLARQSIEKLARPYWAVVREWL